MRVVMLDPYGWQAGLAEGDTPIQTKAPFNPYDVFLLARGPDLKFTAPGPVGVERRRAVLDGKRRPHRR